MPKRFASLTAPDVLKRLKEHDERFEFYKQQGKGSHRMIRHPDIDGREASCPIPFHANRDISRPVLKSIIRHFKLAKDFFA